MSESVIADFVAKFNSESISRGQPIKGRILLSQKRLVLAADDEHKATIPLSAIFDVAVGHAPPDLGDFFQSTVTVAFERGGDRHVAAVEAGEDTIDKFSTVLFKAILNGTQMTVKHPARRGGRVTDESFVAARLRLGPGTVTFANDDSEVEIGLSTITEFDRGSQKIGGSKRPVLQVRHMPEGQSMMTVAATKSPRKMSLLGRYLRLEYSDLLADLRDRTITGDEKELLVAVYSGAGGEGISLANILDREASEVTMLLNRLQEDELVVDTEDGTQLTPKGKIVVSNHLEDVND